MKNGLGYARISDEDQSKNSLGFQTRSIHSWASQNEVQLINFYEDDGVSAKDFNRPDWQRLEDFLANNFRNLDYVLISTYDRLIRNVEEGLRVLRLIEEKYKILIVAVDEPIYSHPGTPQYFLDRTRLLLDAEHERHKIRDRTLKGNRGAKEEGRVWSAPFGYANTRDELNKPTLEVVPEKAKIVKQIFENAAQGYTMKEIGRSARALGWNLQGNSAVRRTLTNLTYAGKVKVPQYRHHPEMLVDSMHPAIITYGLFQTVQDMLQIGIKIKHFRPDLPLRGFIQCAECNHQMTGGPSKGRGGTVYHYYRCDQHKGMNVNAQKAEHWLLDILKELSLSEKMLEKIELRVKEMLKTSLKQFSAHSEMNIKKIDQLQLKLDATEEKYITGTLSNEVYSKWSNKYKAEIAALTSDSNQPQVQREWALFREVWPKLQRMDFMYSQMRVAQKQRFLQHIFSNGLFLGKKGYRTNFIHPLFSFKAERISNLEFDRGHKKTEETYVSPVGAHRGNHFEPFFTFLSTI